MSWLMRSPANEMSYPDTQTVSPVNLRRLEEISAGELEIRRTMIELFISAMEEDLDGFDAAVQAGDQRSARDRAHSIVGASGNVGAVALAETARALLDRKGDQPLGQLRTHADSMRSTFELTRKHLQASLPAS